MGSRLSQAFLTLLVVGTSTMVVGHSPPVSAGTGSHLGDPGASEVGEAAGVSPARRAASADGHSGYVWLDVEGEPLPFQGDEEIEHFLATATVVSEEPIPVGVTNPLKLVLEKDGIRAHAAFKYVDETSTLVSLRVGGRQRVFPVIHDFYLFDCAAYRLDRLLGLHRFPPVIARRVGGRSGAVEMWLENTITEKEREDRGLQPANPEALAKQREVMYVFDNLVGNTDTTNVGNALVDRYWHLWFIDCSRCFVTSPKPLSLVTVTHCERSLWRRLNQVTDEEIRATAAPFLSRAEVGALLTRREAVVDHIASLIHRYGEEAVLYDLDPPPQRPAQW